MTLHCTISIGKRAIRAALIQRLTPARTVAWLDSVSASAIQPPMKPPAPVTRTTGWVTEVSSRCI